MDALGLDETLFQRRGRWNTKMWMMSAVDIQEGLCRRKPSDTGDEPPKT